MCVCVFLTCFCLLPYFCSQAMSRIGDQQIEWTEERNHKMFSEMDTGKTGLVGKVLTPPPNPTS